MLFYDFNLLDNLIKSDFISSLEREKEKLEEIMDLYNSKKDNLLTIIDHMLEMTDIIHKNKLEDFYATVSCLKQSFEQISDIQNLVSKLNDELALTICLYHKSLENNYDEIKANLVEYNKQRDELSQSMLLFQKNDTTILTSVIDFTFINVSIKKRKKQNSIPNNIKLDIEVDPHDNNTLIISEKAQKAYLPFFYSEIQQIYQNSKNQYRTLQEVIDDLYVVDLSQFKNSAIARFKESFCLIRKKEKGSITKALDLGLELMFKYELNPIIVAACRNLDELDIYLDCLEENELHDFTCFEIKFEVMPQLSKKFKKNTFLF